MGQSQHKARHRVVAVVAGSLQTVCARVCHLPPSVFALELRVDHWLHDASDQAVRAVLAHLMPLSSHPTVSLIVTLRTLAQGGRFPGSLAQSLCVLHTLVAALQPDYVDLSHTVSDTALTAFHAAHPGVGIIRSYHHWTQTPTGSALDAVLARMQHPAVGVYKIVTQAQSVLDSLRMLHWVSKGNHQQPTARIPLVAYCMGEPGWLSRLMGVVLGNVLFYAPLGPEDAACVPGAPLLSVCLSLYRCAMLGAQTRIYALLGDPVAHSVGHHFHNAYFAQQGLPHVYMKIRVQAEHLSAFMAHVPGLPFGGWSVTTPHKEAIVPWIKVREGATAVMLAANTLRVGQAGAIFGTHTDGQGVLDVLYRTVPATSLTHYHVLILGAGGAAKGIAHALSQVKLASLRVLNRGVRRANALAHALSIPALSLSQWSAASPALLPPRIDLCIHALPAQSEQAAMQWYHVLAPYLHRHTHYFTLNYRTDNLLIQIAMHRQGGHAIDPQRVFEAQAARQQQYWQASS